MDAAEAELARLWALDEPPPRDLEFELAVAAGLERRRLVREALDWLLIALVGMVGLWAAGPWLAEIVKAAVLALDGSATLVLAGLGAVAAAGLAWITPGVADSLVSRDY